MDTQRHIRHNTREKTRACMVSEKEHDNCLHPCTTQCNLLIISEKLWFHTDDHRSGKLQFACGRFYIWVPRDILDITQEKKLGVVWCQRKNMTIVCTHVQHNVIC